jgi:RecB family exonuclease
VSSLAEFLATPAKEKPWPEKLHHLSASSIGMLFRCPRQFYRRYLLGEKERPGEAIVVGSFFHEPLEWNYQQKIASHADRPLSELVEYLHDAAIPKVLEEEGGADNIRWDTSLETARKDSERILSAYAHVVMPRIQPIGTESKFELEVDGLPVPIIGYVDVWDEERTIDTKTGKQAVSKVKPSWRLQGGLYALATGRPTEYHAISRAKTPKIVTALESDEMVVQRPSEDQANNMRHLFRLAAAQISFYMTEYGYEREWPALGAVPDFTRNMLPCDFCGWRTGCPAWAGATIPTDVATITGAVLGVHPSDAEAPGATVEPSGPAGIATGGEPTPEHPSLYGREPRGDSGGGTPDPGSGLRPEDAL